MPALTAADDRWLRMGEACRKSGFSRPTVRRMCLDGDVVAKKHGPRGDWRILASSLDSHMTPEDVTQFALEHARRLGI